MRRLQVGFLLLVAASGGLVSLYADASLGVVAAGTLGGLFTGACLLWYLRWVTR
ncbi:hypothetical protein GCM10025298_17470 [Natronobiforma cellulositropha]